MSLIPETFRWAPSRHLRADAGRRVALRILQLEPLYPRHPLVPHSSATVNIAERYRVAIRCMACKAANHAASGESVLCLLLGIGSHLCSPTAGRTLQHSAFYNSADSHGWLDD